MSPVTPEALKEAILEKHPSLHAFCKAHKGDIARSSVYQVLNGRYPGNTTKQAERIEKLLHEQQRQEDLAFQLYSVLKKVACSKCKKKGKGSCRRCKATMREQASQINSLLAVERR